MRMASNAKLPVTMSLSQAGNKPATSVIPVRQSKPVELLLAAFGACLCSRPGRPGEDLVVSDSLVLRAGEPHGLGVLGVQHDEGSMILSLLFAHDGAVIDQEAVAGAGGGIIPEAPHPRPCR